ncbi:MAG: transglutaminase-like domain-containing protein, partial [Candidatus Diapherotrites archaeon]
DFMPENYSFEKDYAKTASLVLKFITSEIEYVDHELNLNYWMTPKEIFTNKVGDDEDLAVFLCSLLLGLGDEKAEVVIAELDNIETHAFVITELDNKFYLLDPSQESKFDEFSGKKEDVIAKYSFNKAKIRRFLYKFNHSNYEQFL